MGTRCIRQEHTRSHGQKAREDETSREGEASNGGKGGREGERQTGKRNQILLAPVLNPTQTALDLREVMDLEPLFLASGIPKLIGASVIGNVLRYLFPRYLGLGQSPGPDLLNLLGGRGW